MQVPREKAANGADWRLHVGDAAEVLEWLPAGSVDAVVTDPPYGIHFMQHEWDSFGAGDARSARAFEDWTRQWAEQATVATKPGANWLVFGSPRTYHRMACGVEDAGIRIFNCVMWIYGDGLLKAREIAPGVRLDVKPAYEPILTGRTPANGSLSEAYSRHGTVGVNIEACLIDGGAGSGHWPGDDGSDRRAKPGYDGGFERGGRRRSGRVPSNVLLDEQSAAALDRETGLLRSGGAPRRRGAPIHSGRVYEGQFKGQKTCPPGLEPSRGGPSRFYYCAKASRADRSRSLGNGTVENAHPCVKPLDLMRWLVRLATPPGGTILDPFTGSGSTGVAALLEGRRFIGIEREPRYARTARLRLGESTKQHGCS